MVWAAFSGHGVGAISKISTLMEQYVYQNILLNTMMPYRGDNMPRRVEFYAWQWPKILLTLSEGLLGKEQY